MAKRPHNLLVGATLLILVNFLFTSSAQQAGTVTDVELATFSEDILANDVTNNCGSLVRVNPQGSTCFSCTKDNAQRPLLTVDPAAYGKASISKLLPLHDNYVSGVGTAEVVTSQETAEETAFLDAVMNTPPMVKAQKLLSDKNLLRRTSPRNSNNAARVFREAVHEAWFGMYSRDTSRALGSSGFEHVFLGEVKDGKVSGFHNWVFFSKEEQNNNLNYKGRIGQFIDLGNNKGRIMKHKFDWTGVEKPISSMFVGTSPEFELAIYTVCFFARPGQRCPVKLNGKNVNIQTHFINRQGRRYVASAFPDI